MNATDVTSLAQSADVSPAHPTGRWLLLFPHVTSRRASSRVQVWRLLNRAGAVLARQGLWLLPQTPDRLADARRLARDIEAAGGQCAISAASLLEGFSDSEIESLFREARTKDFEKLANDVRVFTRQHARKRGVKVRPAAQRRAVEQLERRMMELRAISFVATPSQRLAELALSELRVAVHSPDARAIADANRIRARTWVTRRGVFVDRVASAWLIRRFIDPAAIFRFVDPQDYTPQAGELRFDMAVSEYGHEDGRCTFETLCLRFGLHDSGHVGIAEMVHDLDCRESKYNRPETAGFLRILEGVAADTIDDQSRIDTAIPIFDALFRGLAAAASPPSVRSRRSKGSHE